METRIPLLVFGDGPRLPSGLARIARDLTARLVGVEEELGIRVLQVGIDQPDGLHWQGWDLWGWQPNPQDQGRGAIAEALKLFPRESPAPIIFSIVDAARCYDLVRPPTDAQDVDLPGDAIFWGYFPVDAENAQQRIGGPAAWALTQYDRVLGYGTYGAQVLKRTLASDTPVPYLPHGLEPIFHPVDEWSTYTDPYFQEWIAQTGQTTLVVGCLATNQPRKDFGLTVAAVAAIAAQGLPVALWVHTDVLTKAWDLGELVRSFGLQKSQVLVTTDELSDVELAARYSASDVTFAPGLGEGFGYPIVESLACGTPVVHGKYAGGVELIPDQSWLVEPIAWRLESIYALQRPVFNPQDVAAALLTAARFKRSDPAVCRAFCSGSIAHLHWEQLWPRWKAWITKGLAAHPHRVAAEEAQP